MNLPFLNFFLLNRPPASQQAAEGLWDSFVPERMREDAELLRRCRFQIRFGWLGALFAACFALFYLLLGHYDGAAILMACSVTMAAMPGLLRNTGNLTITGHLYAFVLLTGCAGLCGVEGGLSGHAACWLGAVPLCILMLVEWRGAAFWTGLCVLAAAGLAAAEWSGYVFPKTFPPEQGRLISAVGYAGLVPFMAMAGGIFERVRTFRQQREVSEGDLCLRETE